jgi:uncharacterized protein (DUF433 family)
MPPLVSVVHSDPEIMGGTPVFIGTRVPLQTLLDYIHAGDPLDEFLDDFPSVSRAQAVTALYQLALEDAEFREIAAYVLQKNAELYRRLA